MLGKIALAAGFVAVTSFSAGAAVIAFQDFNSLADGGTANGDTFAAGSTRVELSNSGARNIGGPGIDFRTFWTDTRGNAGPVAPGEAGDFIGVNSFSGSNAPNVAADGTPVASGSEHNFEFNDGDGLLELTFEPVDTSGHTNRLFSFDFWINDTGYEGPGQGGPDIFAAIVDDMSGAVTLLSFDDTALEANASVDDDATNWGTYTADLDALGLGPTLSLIIGVDTNAGPENVFIDNVLFEGDLAPVPVPAGLPLLIGALGAFGLLARRGR